MSQSQEYVVRVPKETKKRFHVMRFSAALKVDVTTWKSGRLERENNIKEFKGNNDDIPKFGAGSEFGRELKEEARRKKFGIATKKYNPEDQPWILRVNGRDGRKFKGIREGGVSENTSYYVFFQAHDGAFEAFPVSEWYNFVPIPKYKALTAEEAEEQFTKREKILNFFPIMSQNKKESQGADTGEEKSSRKIKKEFKISDMDDWMDSDDLQSDESGAEDRKPEKKSKTLKKGKGKRKGKKKKGSDDDGDSEPQEDSDEGDFDQREVDYMSDSSSEEEEDEKKVDKSLLKGVADEDALRQLVISEDEDEEENDEKKFDPNAEKASVNDLKKPTELDGKVKVKQEKDDSKSSSSSSSEDSDDSDFDDAKFQSAMFMQKKVNKSKNGTDSNSNSKPNTPPSDNIAIEEKDEKLFKPSSSTKRKLGTESASSKKQKTFDSSSNNDGINEDVVRRYLLRKPMTTTELLQKFRSKRIPMNGNDFMTSFTQILKKLNPEKQKINGKLYLFIKP